MHCIILLNKALNKIRRKILEIQYDDSGNMFVVTFRVERSKLPSLFLRCVNLLKNFNKDIINSQLFFGARIKIYKGQSSTKKEWRWYGKDSFLLQYGQEGNSDFILIPFANLTDEVISSLWDINDDFWEIEFCLYGSKPLGTLGFYSGEVIEFQTTSLCLVTFYEELFHKEFSNEKGIQIKFDVQPTE